MARKKATPKTTGKTKAVKTTRTKQVTVSSSKQKPTGTKVVDYFRFGESYTSLVLGIIAVIIATILLLSIINSRQDNNQTPEVTPTIAQIQSFAISPTAVATPEASITLAPTATKAPTAPTATQAPKVSPAPTVQPRLMTGKTYTVITGDNLWIIAEKVYGSGYNWVDIAKANNLSDPADIHIGNKLKLPQVAPKIATVQTADEDKATTTAKITGTTYKIMPGDTLWNVAVRAYGDGYQWVKIAKENKYTNPDVIHVNNTIKIPR
jgi:nucleoid-associated protein YgaU